MYRQQYETPPRLGTVGLKQSWETLNQEKVVHAAEMCSTPRWQEREEPVHPYKDSRSPRGTERPRADLPHYSLRELHNDIKHRSPMRVRVDATSPKSEPREVPVRQASPDGSGTKLMTSASELSTMKKHQRVPLQSSPRWKARIEEDVVPHPYDDSPAEHPHYSQKRFEKKKKEHETPYLASPRRQAYNADGSPQRVPNKFHSTPQISNKVLGESKKKCSVVMGSPKATVTI
ncbi:hypothetical protein DIPPA_14416 [Diplonema papillatum]|nr:hypothetical protein DIPPA_14416 [Diplonema papillatum]